MDDELDAVAYKHLADARASFHVKAARLNEALADVQRKINAIDAMLGAPITTIDEQQDPPVVTKPARAARTVKPVARKQEMPNTSQLGRAELQSWAGKLKGLSHNEALVRIAEENEGVVRSAEAAHILTGIGHVKGKRGNAAGHMHRLLRESNRFVREGVGMFRLIADANQAKLIDTWNAPDIDEAEKPGISSSHGAILS